MIEVKLLGPPRVERDGVLVAFDTRKALALLAHLAVTDRPRPRDLLADLLWPESDPERARGALRRTLSSLRGAVGAELVEATRDHVRLSKGPAVSVDVDRFHALRAQGDLEGAAELCQGDFLEGFAIRDAPGFEDWVQEVSDGLRRELTVTLAKLAEAREAAGDPAGAITAVRRWLALDALHEPAHQALIRLYAATGDRGAALAQYRECVRTLWRELGVPPLRETTELYEALNRGTYAPTLDAPSPSPMSPPPAPRFVGRAGDLKTLRGVYNSITGAGHVAWIEGEAGIGKTRLADELLTALRRAGANVLVGRAYEGESGLAYAPLVDALRGRLRESDDWLASVDGRALAEAARLLPELGERRPVGAVSPLDGPGAETRFVSGVWDTLFAASFGDDAPGVLFIDDAQWADEATLGLLSYGLRRLSGRPMLVLLTWRTPHDHSLRLGAVTASRSGAGTVLRLDRLGEEAVGDFVRLARPGDPESAVAHQLWKRTEGVPLLLVEYVRALDGDEDLPAGVRDLLRARLAPLSETGRQILAAAAVLGRSFDAATVRRVSGRTDVETVVALEEVVSHGLVREGATEYDFGHDLLRAVVYAETSLARRRLLHGRAAATLKSPAAVARHLQLAGREREAAHAFRDAGMRARAVFANAEALSHLQAALALGHPDRAGVLIDIADVQTVVGDYQGALLSLELAATEGDAAVLATAEHHLGRLHYRRGDYLQAREHLKAALASVPDSETASRAAIIADLSLAAHSGGELDEAWSLAHHARALAEQGGDSRSIAQAHNLLGMIQTGAGNVEDALSHLARSSQLADEVDDHNLRIAALNNLALAHRAGGGLETAMELTAAALDLCVRVGDRHREAALRNNLADLLHAAGRPDDALTQLKVAVEIFADVGMAEEPQPGIWKLAHW